MRCPSAWALPTGVPSPQWRGRSGGRSTRGGPPSRRRPLRCRIWLWPGRTAFLGGPRFAARKRAAVAVLGCRRRVRPRRAVPTRRPQGDVAGPSCRRGRRRRRYSSKNSGLRVNRSWCRVISTSACSLPKNLIISSKPGLNSRVSPGRPAALEDTHHLPSHPLGVLGAVDYLSGDRLRPLVIFRDPGVDDRSHAPSPSLPG
jgi:hypothetical protein